MARGPGVNLSIREKRYGGAGLPVLGALELAIEPGSVVALVGSSGVGKSTLLRMIAGIDTAFDGSIKIGSQAASEASPPGLVFQDSRLLPWLTTIDNLLAVREQTTKADAARWLQRVGLGDVLDVFPGQLSGGMQRRVALARALSVNPKFLLLDEPFVSLDRHLVVELEALVSDLITAEGSTAILVTHLIEDAAALADRLVMLSGRPARIVADFKLDLPRAERNPIELARLSTELAAQLKDFAS